MVVMTPATSPWVQTGVVAVLCAAALARVVSHRHHRPYWTAWLIAVIVVAGLDVIILAIAALTHTSITTGGWFLMAPFAAGILAIADTLLAVTAIPKSIGAYARRQAEHIRATHELPGAPAGGFPVPPEAIADIAARTPVALAAVVAGGFSATGETLTAPGLVGYTTTPHAYALAAAAAEIGGRSVIVDADTLDPRSVLATFDLTDSGYFPPTIDAVPRIPFVALQSELADTIGQSTLVAVAFDAADSSAAYTGWTDLAAALTTELKVPR